MKIFKLMLILLLYIIRVHAQTLTCQVNGGVVSCPPPVVCPGAQVTFTATVLAAVASNVWLLPNGTCSGSATPNSIVLTQGANACRFSTMTCGPYTATNVDPGANIPCLTSTLSVTATSNMTSSVIKAGTQDVSGINAIVNTTQIIVVASPGPVGNINVTNTSVDQLTVAWAPPTTGGVPTSYNVSINDSSSPVVIPDNGSSLYTHNFTGLTSDTLYTVSVVAINCAGTSNVTSANRRTLAVPPASTSVKVVLVLNPDNTSLQLNISWTSVGGSVTMYTVRVVTGGSISVGQGSATCTSSPCLYVQNVTGFATNTSYTIFVASVNGDGVTGLEISTIYGTAPTPTPSPSPSPTPTPSPTPPPPNPKLLLLLLLLLPLLAVVIVIVIVGLVWKKKGNGGHKSKEDRVELQKSGGTAERSIPPHDVGAMYQDPNDIKHTQGPAGDTYAVTEKKPKGGAPADGGGALYQDPKDIEHTKGPAGEVYAVADKKPKEVPHQPAPTGDMYAVADPKKQSKRKVVPL